MSSSARPPATPWQSFWALALAFLLLLAWDASGFDLIVARSIGGANGFPLQNHWFTSGVLYKGPRAIGWLVILPLAASLWISIPGLADTTRRERIWCLVTTLACLVIVPLIKHGSATSCPWSLSEFGGTAHYVSHWSLLRDGGPGRCFPSGHALTGFAFLSGAFALRRSSPRAARFWLTGVVVVGILAGGTQTLRGAHYVSHSLWTAWICWAITAASFHIARRWREPSTVAALAVQPKAV